MTLAETQAAFFSLVTDPEQIETRPELGLFDQRLRIYANMYLWRLVDGLRNDFPKLAAVVGDDDFSALMSQYLRQHPSEHPDVGQVGRHLVSFLRQNRDPTRREDLADLAELEQARSEVFLEADRRPIDGSAISELGAAFPQARLRLVPALQLRRFEYHVAPVWRSIDDEQAPPAPLVVPALQLRRFEYHVAPVWRSIDDEQAPPAPLAQPNEVAIWRKEFAVYHVVLAAEEAEALRRALSGARLEQVCAAFADQDSPAQAAFAALSSWFVEGWVAALEIDPG